MKLPVKMKENIHEQNPYRVYGDKNTVWGEKVYAQTDFHACCDFQRARGRVELVSCKQEHWSASMIVSRWRIDGVVFYSFVCRLRPERNNGNVGEVLAAPRRAYWRAVRIDYLVRPQEERRRTEWEITRGKDLKITRQNGCRWIPLSKGLNRNFVFPSVCVLIFYGLISLM